VALAQADDVAVRLGRELDASETLLVETRLNDAERMLKRRIDDLLSQAATDADFHDEVVRVESEMILRLVKNPDGYSQESDGNYSYAIYQAVASGKLEVTQDEWESLGVKGGGMFTIQPVLPEAFVLEGAVDPSKGMPPWWWDFGGV
jgi:hypothetical protein